MSAERRTHCPFCDGYLRFGERTTVHEEPTCAEFAKLVADIRSMPSEQLERMALSLDRETGKA